MKNLLIKTKNKLPIDKKISVSFDIREHQNVLLKLYIQLRHLKQKYFLHRYMSVQQKEATLKCWSRLYLKYCH